MAKIRKQTTNADKDVEERELLSTSGVSATMMAISVKTPETARNRSTI